MKKRLTAILLAAALLLTLLAGCTGGETSSPASKSSKAGTESQSASTGGEDSAEPVKLSAVTLRGTTDGNFPYPIIEELAKQANVEVTWQVEASADWKTKKSVLLASGKLPDLFFGPDLLDSEVNTGSFLDWTPYLDKAPNIKRFLDETPDARAMATTAEGKIYGIPNMIAFRPESGDVLYVNKTWCDQLNIALPKTTEEFYQMLIAFRDQDPNGNGEKDEIGITGVGANNNDNLTEAGTLAWIFPAFGVVINHNDSYCMVKDGVPEFQPTTENYRKALEYINKLWTEGLIDSEYFGLDFATQAAKFRGETLLLGSGSGWTMSNNTGNNLEHYELIDPLIGPDGDQYWSSSAYYYKVYVNKAAISASCADPDAAVRFFDLCYDEYNGFQITYGSEGVAVDKDADENPEFLDVPEEYTDPEFKFLHGLDTVAPTWASPEFVSSIGGENDAMEKYNSDVRYGKYFLPESRMPYIVYDTATLDEMAILKTDIKSYVQQSLVDFIMNGVTDEKWDSYKNQLEKMNLSRLVEIYTEGYQKSAK